MSKQCKVTCSNGDTHEGAFFCFDPITKAVVLSGPDNSYNMIHGNLITAIEGDTGDFKPPSSKDIGMSVVPMEKVNQKEIEALMKAEEEVTALNLNVDPKVQALFDRLRKVFPCTWSGEKMVVMDNIAIAPPYDKATVLGGYTDDGLQRISMVLEGERKKLNMG